MRSGSGRPAVLCGVRFAGCGVLPRIHSELVGGRPRNPRTVRPAHLESGRSDSEGGQGRIGSEASPSTTKGPHRAAFLFVLSWLRLETTAYLRAHVLRPQDVGSRYRLTTLLGK